jgi:hypothetical protein
MQYPAITRLIYLFSLLPLLNLSVAYGQGRSPLFPKKIEVPPVIDGILNEDIWNKEPDISGFKTWMPDYGKDLPFNTYVWLAYDEENLYYAFRCLDPEPDKIKASVDSRDKIRLDDWICINLDSYNDQQTLYCIYSNPNGIQMDTRFAAGLEDLGMDLVFYSAGQIDSAGYSIEIKLPLKSIRFSNREPVMMAATFERYISRLTTDGTFPPLDPAQGINFLTQTQPLQYNDVKHYTLFEILPALTYSYQAKQSEGKMAVTENKPDAGLTMKFGITSQLILDATLNPDFSQVEADAGQIDVNLRYQLYYPEKRPFFQEGNENFQIGSTGTSVLDPIISFVHTRNIINPLTGVKLSGKIGPKNSLSVLFGSDRIQEPDDTIYGRFAHLPVIRYKRSLKNDSYLGLLGTSVLKKNCSNFVAGADGNIRVSKPAMLEFHSLFSNTSDTLSGLENKSGHSASISIHSETRNFNYAFSATDISEFFSTQTGFIERTGISIFTGKITPKIYTESKVFRKFDFSLFSGQLRDNIYNKWETYNSFTITSLLGGSVTANLKYNYSTEIYNDQSFKTSGILAMLTGTIGTKFDGTLSWVRRNAIYYPVPEQGYGNSLTCNLRYLPVEKLHTQLTVSYQNLYSTADDEKIFDYLITRGRITFQLNKYLFIRAIAEYNSYRELLKTDFLASFTYIPGTVFHIGYGSLYEYKTWDGSDYIDGNRLLEMKRGFFAKVSYLFRL